jgi:hypothetical protein
VVIELKKHGVRRKPDTLGIHSTPPRPREREMLFWLTTLLIASNGVRAPKRN